MLDDEKRKCGDKCRLGGHQEGGGGDREIGQPKGIEIAIERKEEADEGTSEKEIARDWEYGLGPPSGGGSRVGDGDWEEEDREGSTLQPACEPFTLAAMQVVEPQKQWATNLADGQEDAVENKQPRSDGVGFLHLLLFFLL